MPGHAGTGGRDVIFAWEQCKLGDVAKINSGKDYKGLQPGKIPVYGTGGYMLSVNDKLSDIDAIGIGRKGTIDKPYYLNAPFWTVDTLFYVTPRGTVDISFMFPLFKNINWKRYDESTGVPSLSKNTIKKIRVSFPQNNEQVKIGDLFQKITQIITLHEEKKRQLERLKSALLQKMFADKSGYPVVRFEGFSDEWEQCKLGDVCEEVSGNNGNVKDLPILTISAANGWMNQKDRFSQVIAGNELKKYTLLKKGHLAYNHGNSKQAKYGTVFVQNLYDQALVPRVYHSFKMKTENNPYYVEYYFATKKLDRELARLVTSGARMDGLLNINKKDFFKIKFEVPTPVEQSLIGTILQKLDQTITLHDQKLNLLKLVKQSLLQKMFI
ncbi:hypothetical protein BTH63_06790 [Lactobacillus delbrueckii subsp. bulgaricus]|nr:hypothetical protein [Lactobacillus delbrueckii subsp. bulgaricus]